MAKDVRVGFIGGGTIARIHADAIGAVGAAKILGVIDADTHTAESFAQRYGADHAGSDLNALLGEKELDAVFVCTPNSFHAPHAIAALRAGKHVFCEKPMATNVRDCRKMIQEAKRTKRILTVGYVRRFRTESELIKSKIQRGELGNVYYAESRWLRRRGVPGYGKWFTTKKLSGGGPLIDVGCHMLDLVCWFLDHPRPTRVFAATGCHLSKRNYVYTNMWAGPPKPGGPYDVEDYASAMIRFDNGTTLLLQASWAINIPEPSRLEVWLAGDRQGCSLKDHIEFVGQDSGGLTNTRFELPAANGFERQMAHFLRCVRNGSHPRVRPQEALEVQRILDAIYRSGELGREVVLR